MKIYRVTPLIVAVLIVLTLNNYNAFSNSVEFLGDVRIIPCGYNSIARVSGGSRWDTKSIGNASMDPNIWNIRVYEGSVVMSCSAGGSLIVDNNVSLSTNLGNTYAYHSIIYGPKPWGMPSNHPPSIDPVKVPEPLSVYVNEKRLVMYTKFSIGKLDQSTNFAYDIWITEVPRYSGGPGTNDVELMIWIYRGGNKSVNAPIPAPAGTIVSRVYIPTLINGNLVNVSWSVWFKPDVEWGGWDYVAFVLGTPSTDVAIDLTEILKVMVEVLGRQKPGLYGSDGSKLYSYYINDIEFGTEVFSYMAGPSGIRWIAEKFYLVAFKVTTSLQNALKYIAENYVKQQTPTPSPPTHTATDAGIPTITITHTYVMTATQTVTQLVYVTNVIEKTHTITDTLTKIDTVTNVVTDTVTIVKDIIEVDTITETVTHSVTLIEEETMIRTTTIVTTTTAVTYVVQPTTTHISEIPWSLTVPIVAVLLTVGVCVGFMFRRRSMVQ